MTQLTKFTLRLAENQEREPLHKSFRGWAGGGVGWGGVGVLRGLVVMRLADVRSV